MGTVRVELTNSLLHFRVRARQPKHECGPFFRRGGVPTGRRRVVAAMSLSKRGRTDATHHPCTSAPVRSPVSHSRAIDECAGDLRRRIRVLPAVEAYVPWCATSESSATVIVCAVASCLTL